MKIYKLYYYLFNLIILRLSKRYHIHFEMCIAVRAKGVLLSLIFFKKSTILNIFLLKLYNWQGSLPTSEPFTMDVSQMKQKVLNSIYMPSMTLYSYIDFF